MVSDFLLSWLWLNLFFLLAQQQKDLANSGIPFDVITYFEYRKMEEDYWTGKHLLDQIKTKAFYQLGNPYIQDMSYYLCLTMQ